MTPDDLRIRRAAKEEVELLLAIQRDSSLVAFKHVFPPEKHPFPTDDVRSEWVAALSDASTEVWIAELDGIPSGLVSIGDEWVNQIYVTPQSQRRGMGNALLDLAEERLRVKGVRTAKLWTLELNVAARRFYEHRGWEQTDETRTVDFPPYPTNVQYQKRLE